jgi:hypothetical protein
MSSSTAFYIAVAAGIIGAALGEPLGAAIGSHADDPVLWLIIVLSCTMTVMTERCLTYRRRALRAERRLAASVNRRRRLGSGRRAA